jgi:hypothetical protein
MSKLAKILRARANAWAAQRAEEVARSDLHDELLQSGIHTSPSRFDRRKEMLSAALSQQNELDLESAARAAREVSLIVYGWHNVQPGPLSWVFPSVRAAFAAAKAMRNAVSWAIVSGRLHASELAEARATGRVILEHLG